MRMIIGIWPVEPGDREHLVDSQEIRNEGAAERVSTLERETL